MMETGRKFWIALLGMALVTFLPIVSKSPAVGQAIGAVVALGIAFITGNAAITVAHARSDATSSQESRLIEERRNQLEGYEPTP